MFSISQVQFSSPCSGSTRRKMPPHRMVPRFLAQGAFALAVMFCLTTALLYTGCNIEPEEGFVLEGEWKSPFDSYTVTSTSVDYFMDNSEWGSPNSVLKGSIKKTVSFSENAGVLIILVTEASDFTVGKYAGVYYKEGAKNSVKMATAFNTDYSPLEVDTLAIAQTLFTVNNADTHVTLWGSYTK